MGWCKSVVHEVVSDFRSGPRARRDDHPVHVEGDVVLDECFAGAGRQAAGATAASGPGSDARRTPKPSAAGRSVLETGIEVEVNRGQRQIVDVCPLNRVTVGC